MKILLTGATGFIGTHLRQRLNKDHSLVAIVRPKTDISELQKENIETVIYSGDIKRLINDLSEHQIDGCIHLASLYLKTHESDQISSLIESNVLFPTHLFEIIIKLGIPWMINTGTFWQHYQNKTYSPVNLYAATKQAFIDIARFYQETSSTTFTTLKLSDTFGPGDTRPKIFNLWQQNAQSSEILNMSGGEQIIDICYIQDIVDAYVLLIDLIIQSPEEIEDCYAVTSGVRLTLKELAIIFEKTTNKHLNICWGVLPYREREVMVPWTLGKIVPGWKPNTSIEDGIKITFGN